MMESLSRAAVAEICKLISSECVEMRLEIRRGRKEIEALKGKIRDLKREAQNPSVVAVSLTENQQDGGTVEFGPAELQVFLLIIPEDQLHSNSAFLMGLIGLSAVKL